MATTLPGSPYVESSDLVAGYPGVSESLAERVDTVGVLPFADSTARGTALPSPTDGQYSYLQDTNSTEYWDGAAWVASGTTPGLTLITSETFTTSSGVSIDNCFTSTYDNYVVQLTSVGSGEFTGRARLRVGGVDNTTASSYVIQAVRGITTAASAFNNTNNLWDNVFYGNATAAIASITFYRPAIAATTFFLGQFFGRTDYVAATGGYHTQAVAYDGLTVFPSSGTFTGNVQIYGYNKGA